MCGAPERLPAFGARTLLVFITIIMDQNVQLLNRGTNVSCIPRSRAEGGQFLLYVILHHWTLWYGTKYRGKQHVSV
jgi:hypothetical protein